VKRGGNRAKSGAPILGKKESSNLSREIDPAVMIHVSLRPGEAKQLMSYQQAKNNAGRMLEAGLFDLSGYMASQLCELFPGKLEPQLQMLNVYTAAGILDEAEKLIKKLNKKKKISSSIPFLLQAANYYRATSQVERAIENFKKVIKQNAAFSGAYLGLGLCYMMTGDKAKASLKFRKTLELDPTNAQAYYFLASLSHEPLNDKDLLNIESLLANPALPQKYRVDLHFALSWEYRNRDIEQEIFHLKTANDLMCKIRPWNRDEYIRFASSYKSIDYQSTISSGSFGHDLDYRPVFIVALPRSGTTLLEQIMGQHSALMPVGETSAFRIADKKAAGRTLQEFPQWVEQGSEQADIAYLKYTDQFFKENKYISAAKGQRIIEKSVDNIFFIGQILLTYPNAKIIDLSRNAMDIALSCYRANFSTSQEFSYKLEWFVEYYKIHKDLMAHWKSIFPDYILSISYEDLVDDPETLTRKILGFCNLDWEEDCLDYHKKKQVIKTSSSNQANQPVYKTSVGGSEKYRELLAPVADALL
jgi:tetratricopeptide (TPR) repeat protein